MATMDAAMTQEICCCEDHVRIFMASVCMIVAGLTFRTYEVIGTFSIHHNCAQVSLLKGILPERPC